MSENRDEEKQTGATSAPELSDEELARLRRQRFEERVRRVLAVMQQERIDWRGAAYVAPDGRIGVRVMPVEIESPAPGGPPADAGRRSTSQSHGDGAGQ